MRLPTHGRYGFSSIGTRHPFVWPEERTLAVYFLILVEQHAFRAGIGEDISTLGAPQTHRNYAWRDYGQRVGLWRLLALFDGLKLPVSFAVNSELCRSEPELVERLGARGGEIVAYGRTSAERPFDTWERDEARRIEEATEALAGTIGARPSGWLSPAFAESRVTPDLVKEAEYA